MNAWTSASPPTRPPFPRRDAPAEPAGDGTGQPRRPHPTPAERAEALAIYAAGESSAKVVAERFGRSAGWVLQMARASGVPALTRRGASRAWRALLPEIIARLRAGERQRHISRALSFNVAHLIWRVRHGHVSAPELLAIVGPARTCRRRGYSSRHARMTA